MLYQVVYKHEKHPNPLNTEIMTFADRHTDRQTAPIIYKSSSLSSLSLDHHLQSGSEGLQAGDVAAKSKYSQDSHDPENLKHISDGNVLI